MSTMSLVRSRTLTERLGEFFFGALARMTVGAGAHPINMDHAADARLQRMAHFLIGAIVIVVLCLAPEIVAAQGAGGFLPSDTTGFRNDVKSTWTLISYVAIFLGLVVMVVGMFLPIASWMKWGAIGAVVVGAFGESVVTWLYTTGGNTAGTSGIG